MKIAKDSVVRFHYTVSEVGQEPIESSRERGEPLAILIGHGNIIPGLETAMMDKEAGESFGVDVKSADAYGERREGLSHDKARFRDPFGQIEPTWVEKKLADAMSTAIPSSAALGRKISSGWSKTAC